MARIEKISQLNATPVAIQRRNSRRLLLSVAVLMFILAGLRVAEIGANPIS